METKRRTIYNITADWFKSYYVVWKPNIEKVEAIPKVTV